MLTLYVKKRLYSLRTMRHPHRQQHQQANLRLKLIGLLQVQGARLQQTDGLTPNCGGELHIQHLLLLGGILDHHVRQSNRTEPSAQSLGVEQTAAKQLPGRYGSRGARQEGLHHLGLSDFVPVQETLETVEDGTPESERLLLAHHR